MDFVTFARKNLVSALPRRFSEPMQRRELPELTTAVRRPQLAPSRRPDGDLRRGGVLGLQRSAGNHAVSQLLSGSPGGQQVPGQHVPGRHAQRTQLQRVEHYPKGGGKVTDVNGPGTNERRPVLAVQERLIALGDLTKADADRARMDAQTGRIMASDIVNTTAAITRCEAPTLTEPAARKAFEG